MGQILVIKKRIQSQNRSQYAHWSVYRKERDEWFILLRQQLLPRQAAERRVKIAIRSYRTRLLDFANLVGGSKPIPDCLIKLGYVRDDSPQWFSCHYEQFQVAKSEERTEIEFLGESS